MAFKRQTPAPAHWASKQRVLRRALLVMALTHMTIILVQLVSQQRAQQRVVHPALERLTTAAAHLALQQRARRQVRLVRALERQIYNIMTMLEALP